MQLAVGRVGRPHGIRGEVSIDVRTDEPDTRFSPGSVLATNPPEVGPLTVESAHWHSGRLLVRFAGAHDRTAVERMRGTLLVVDSDDLPPVADPDEFHDHELLDLAVVTTGGVEVGRVTDVLHLPAQDVLVVRRDDGGETLVPFVAQVVPEVAPEAGRLVLDPPPGLLD